MATHNAPEEKNHIQQPTSPEQVSPEQKQAHKEAIENEDLTVNPGDRVDGPKSLEEKAKQVAVDAPDITGDHVTVPTYFVVEEGDGEKEALHHVKDAEEISDVIRQARTDEDGERNWR
ncbi:MAG: hypothetical protein F6K04_18540 [Leptolyngbya sp. SIO4C5]|uniref:hypothetical protein n=1 Tax=Sphaerothrix gracilis TaxID=3151835 RepID=UPI0013C0E908|nr:hypothetical protein [Leptolyngbya sp. SIO4C5]